MMDTSEAMALDAGLAGYLQDITYRPFAERLFEACHELPKEACLQLIAETLRQFHALPLDVPPKLAVVI